VSVRDGHALPTTLAARRFPRKPEPDRGESCRRDEWRRSGLPRSHCSPSTPDAEEAAQDGFVKAYRNLGRFRQGAPFRPWLLAIVGNEARNRRVAAGRGERLALRAGEERSVAVAAAAEAEALAAGERQELLALGLRKGTVKSRLSRALERLRKEIEADG
jgi:DNA-directed RNA polymerase specialized sigma24 family protein